MEENKLSIVSQYLEKYDNFLNKLSHSIRFKCPKLELEDIKQSIILSVLLNANSYNADKNTKPSTYFSCIAVNAGSAIIKQYFSNKNRANIDAVPFEEIEINGEKKEYKGLSLCEKESDLLYPESLYTVNELSNIIAEKMKTLKPIDYKAFSLYLNGYDISFIAKNIDKSVKTTYNIINRIKELIQNDLK